MHINIDEARDEHLATWLGLREAVYSGLDEAFHTAEMQNILRDDSKTCFLAVDEESAICGMVEVSLRNVVDGCLSSPVGYIEGIYVPETHRKHGIAKRLSQRAEDWCRDKGCREIATDAELANESAQRFHRSMGYRETYRIVQFLKEL